MGKATKREENFTIIMMITMGFYGVLEFLDSNPPPHLKGSSIYTGCVCFNKAAESSNLFKHLSANLRDG